MAKPITYTWTAEDPEDVCLVQTVVFATTPSLVLNGNLSTSADSLASRSVSFGNVSRTVSITSVNNLSAVNFTINGTLNGRTKTEIKAGPTAGATVYTLTTFNTVTSITASANAAAVKIGSGDTGTTNWFCHDPYVPYPSLMVQVINTNGEDLEYSFEATLCDAINSYVATNASFGIVVPNPDDVNAYTVAMDHEIDDFSACYDKPARYSRIIVSDSNGASFVAMFMQQGLTN